MIIEPTPTNPRSPLRRGLRAAGLVLPVVLLGAVIGAGVLGPQPEPTTPPASPIAALPTPRATNPTATPEPAIVTNADDPVPPEEFGGLPVADIGRVLETRAGSPPGTVVAIRGFLRVDGAAAGGCADEPPGSLGPWCERLGILAAQPPTSRSSSTCRIASHRHLSPHLHLSIPAGVRLPQAVDAAGQVSVDDGAQVLVIGRFAPAAATCVRAPWGCGETFVVERFAWVDGVRVGPTPLIADALQTGTRHVSPFGMVLGAGDLPLAAVLSWPDDIARLDPDAAALAEAGRPGEPVWYVRVLEGSAAPGGERPVRWMLLADRDFHVIGSFHEPATTADQPSTGSG
ncbi:MAG: hypothetical protein QG587_1382 [Chloroflexota bacterium]|nr:hypothetical protein [Chloroflexota bacterium]